MSTAVSPLIPVVAHVGGAMVRLRSLVAMVHPYGVLGYRRRYYPSTEQLLAPFAGRVTVIDKQRHLLGFTTGYGLNGWLQLGKFSGAVQSPRFRARVKIGDWVTPGQVLAVQRSEVGNWTEPQPVVATISAAVVRMLAILLAASNRVAAVGTVIPNLVTSLAGTHRVATIGPPAPSN